MAEAIRNEGKPMAERARLLVVDDDPLVASSIEYGLRKLPDCKVATASDGREALQLFEQQPFDVLITDYQMPGIDGVVLAARIRWLYPQTAIIMVTGYDTDVLRERATRASIQHVLDKPVRPGEIRALVSTMLEGRQARAD